MTTGIITPQQLEFLLLLSKTGFITNKHLEQVGFAKLKNSNHYLTKRLLDGQYIGRVMVVAGFGFGRKVMYFLSKKGAELISETYNIDLEDIAYTPIKGGIYTAKDGNEVTQIRTDFQHKEAYISAFLAFNEYLKQTDYDLVDYKHYYQLKGEKSTTLTLNGKNFRPDGIWFTESIEPNAPRFVYVVEIHRHSERKHIIRQLQQQVEAIKQKSVQNRFNFEHPYLVISIFTDENLKVMQSILEELKQSENWKFFEKFFLFARLEDLQEDFYKGLGYFGNVRKPIPKTLKIPFKNGMDIL